MNKIVRFGVLAVTILLTAGCAGEVSSSSATSTQPITFKIRNYTLNVGAKQEIIPIGLSAPLYLSYSFDGDALLFHNQTLYVLESDTVTEVTATNEAGYSSTFTVTVPADTYVSSQSEETSEGWLDPLDVVAPKLVHDGMPKGIDMSTVAAIYAAGGQYYNDEGKAEDVFRIIKNAGVNYVRLRLWNDPFNHTENGPVSYGGGGNNLSTDIELAYLAKDAGLKLYIDFHYSDFWADPSKQIFPKDWADYTSAEQIKSAIYDYTYNSLAAFMANGVLPDMVSLGNETTAGMLLQLPGPVNENLTGGEPYYTSQCYSAPSSISAPNKSQNFHDYIASANKAVKDIDSDILTMIHVAKGLSAPNWINDYYAQFADIDYDIIGLSAYPYYQGSPSVIASGLASISAAYPDKLITLAETSYGFTYAKEANTSNIFDSGEVASGYGVSVTAQAQMVRDMLEAIDSINNGYGLFYWEGAFIPVAGVGWGDSKSKDSWANQTFFTYAGHVLPSLRIFE